MKKTIVLPTWILVRLMMPILPKQHPWKNKRFTLTDWSTNSTELNNAFSLVFWVCGICLVFILFKLNLKTE